MKKIMLLGLLALVLGVSGCSKEPTNENNNENADNKDDTTDLPYCEDDDLELDIPTFDDSTKYDYDPANLEVKSGRSNVLMPPEGSEEKTYTVTTNSTNSLIVDTSTPFSYGTIEATVTQNQANDAGIIFKCEDNGLDQFWEGTVAYYFFLIVPTLGKVRSFEVWIDACWFCIAIASLSSERKISIFEGALNPSRTLPLSMEMIFISMSSPIITPSSCFLESISIWNPIIKVSHLFVS